MLTPWIKLTTDTTMLALESNTVIGLRLTQFAFGRGTLSETHKMVTEKSFAFAEAATTLLRGGSAETVVNSYRTRVRANVHRLAGHTRARSAGDL
jgi:hypothetical protein